MFFDRLYILEDRIAEPLEGCFFREVATLREAPTITGRDDKLKSCKTTTTESLILAQDERWRRA
jgi:hypothetical protein